MRTTITIEDQLLKTLKRRATESGTTVSKLIEDSVRLALAPTRERPSDQDFELVTFGKGGRFTSYDIDKVSSLQELDDFEEFGKRGS